MGCELRHGGALGGQPAGENLLNFGAERVEQTLALGQCVLDGGLLRFALLECGGPRRALPVERRLTLPNVLRIGADVADDLLGVHRDALDEAGLVDELVDRAGVQEQGHEIGVPLAVGIHEHPREFHA